MVLAQHQHRDIQHTKFKHIRKVENVDIKTFGDDVHNKLSSIQCDTSNAPCEVRRVLQAVLHDHAPEVKVRVTSDRREPWLN